VDVTLSSNDDIIHPLEPDALDDQKVSAGDDIGDDGATSTEPTAPGLIKSGMAKQSKPSAADQALAIVPPTGGCG
jgi:hypothetical protein